MGRDRDCIGFCQFVEQFVVDADYIGGGEVCVLCSGCMTVSGLPTDHLL